MVYIADSVSYARRLFEKKEEQLWDLLQMNAGPAIQRIAARELIEAAIELGTEEAKIGINRPASCWLGAATGRVPGRERAARGAAGR